MLIVGLVVGAAGLFFGLLDARRRRDQSTAISASVMPLGLTARRRSAFSAAAVVALVVAGSSALAPVTASAATTAINQCNYHDPLDAQEVTCDVFVANFLDIATGATSSVVTTRACTGAPAVRPQSCIDTGPTTSVDLVGSVNQCNNSANPGGSIVTCNVRIVNTITGSGTTSPATVNQCVGSGGGGGADAPDPDATECAPVSTASGADVIQCNTAGNGGGGIDRVRCAVLTSTVSALWPVSVVQCNDSANGGGDLVTCSAQITTDILAPGQVTTTTVATGETTTTSATGETTTTIATGETTTTDASSRTSTTGLVNDTLSVDSTSPRPTFPGVTLPRTGSSTASTTTFVLGLLALVLGATAILFARRRPAHQR